MGTLTNRSSGSAFVLWETGPFAAPRLISVSSRKGFVDLGRGGFFSGESRKVGFAGESRKVPLYVGEVVRLRKGLFEERLRVKGAGGLCRSAHMRSVFVIDKGRM